MNWLRFTFVLLSCLFMTAASGARFPRGFVSNWQTVKVGAGGWVRGLDIQCDQGVGVCAGAGSSTILARGDGYGLYLWQTTGSCTPNVLAPCFKQIVTDVSLPAGASAQSIGNGFTVSTSAWEARVAPSNTNIFYMIYGDGIVYKTTNRGTTWTATNFTPITGVDPGTNGQFGSKLAIDPQNANIVIACINGSGVSTNGCWRTVNGGTSWTQITGLTNSTSMQLVAFDPSSSVVGGATQGVYLISNGTGVYHTTGGVAGAWTLLNSAGMPTGAVHLRIDTAGVVYVIANTFGDSGELDKYNGAWSTVIGGCGCQSIAIDPTSNSKILISMTSGGTIYTTNAFSTFTGAQAASLTATDVPWLATTALFLTAGDIVYDPAQVNTAYLSAGVGVWKQNPTTGTTVTYTSQSAGIENLTGQTIQSIPGGDLWVSVQDFALFNIVNQSSYATSSTRGVLSAGAADINGAWGWDFGALDPTVVGCICTNNNSNTAYAGLTTNASTSGAGTWNAFAATPTGYPASSIGGSLAIANANVMVWMTSADATTAKLNVTSNGGTTWSAPAISGIGTTGDSGWQSQYRDNGSRVCTDKVATNPTFYAVNYGGSTSTPGMYKLVWNGSIWTSSRPFTGTLDGFGSANMMIRCVPGNTGDLFFSGGYATPGPFPHLEAFYECIDTGTMACNPIPNLREIWSFGFGAAKPGGSGYPSIYIAGWANCGQTGINNCPAGASGYTWGEWRSTDHAATWSYLASAPLGILNIVESISGDMNTYGTVYVQTQSAGVVSGQFD